MGNLILYICKKNFYNSLQKYHIGEGKGRRCMRFMQEVYRLSSSMFSGNTLF